MQVTRTSTYSRKIHTMELNITPEQLAAIEARTQNIQTVAPYLSASEREFLMTGATQAEWDELFPDVEEGDPNDDEVALLLNSKIELRQDLVKVPTELIELMKSHDITEDFTTEILASYSSDKKKYVGFTYDEAVTLSCRMWRIDERNHRAVYDGPVGTLAEFKASLEALIAPPKSLYDAIAEELSTKPIGTELALFDAPVVYTFGELSVRGAKYLGTHTKHNTEFEVYIAKGELLLYNGSLVRNALTVTEKWRFTKEELEELGFRSEASADNPNYVAFYNGAALTNSKVVGYLNYDYNGLVWLSLHEDGNTRTVYNGLLLSKEDLPFVIKRCVVNPHQSAHLAVVKGELRPVYAGKNGKRMVRVGDVPSERVSIPNYGITSDMTVEQREQAVINNSAGLQELLKQTESRNKLREADEVGGILG